MNTDSKLSTCLEQWFASRRQFRDWVARHPVASPQDGADAEQFSDLRDRCYDFEWALLNLGARKQAWEEALEHESDIERAEAMELRHAVADLEMVSARQQAAAHGLSVSAWWFIPYAVWVGLPRPAAWARPADHAQPMLMEVARMFREAVQEGIPSRIQNESRIMDEPLRAAFQFVPGICADALRQFVLPPGGVDDWPARDRDALDFRADPSNPLRAGCVGVYLAADSYRHLALLRDMVREIAIEVAQANADVHLKLGPLLPRHPALEEAELLRWDLWAHQVMGLPCPDNATRHVRFTVERRDGRPQRLVGEVADMAQGQCLVPALAGAPAVFSCRLGDEGLLHDALAPFISCADSPVSWSVHQARLPSDPAAPPPPA